MEKIAGILLTIAALMATAASVAMLARFTLEGRINLLALLAITTAVALFAGLAAMVR